MTSLRRWSFRCQFLSLKLVKRDDAGCSQRKSDLLSLEYDHLSLNAVIDGFILMQLFENRNTGFKVSYKWSRFKYMWKEKMKQSLCEGKKLYLFSKSKSACLFSKQLMKCFKFSRGNYRWMALIWTWKKGYFLIKMEHSSTLPTRKVIIFRLNKCSYNIHNDTRN